MNAMKLARHNLAAAFAFRPRCPDERKRRATNIAQIKAWIEAHR